MLGDNMRHAGFTLIEMMISLFIGGLILGGVMFTYLGMKTTTKGTMAIGELQESGRLAINIMQRDIEQVGFWGNYYNSSFNTTNTTSLTNITPDCFEGDNNGSFPDLVSNSNFKTIYAKTAASATELNCINNPVKNTDILQIKFVQGNQLEVSATANETAENSYYFLAEQELARFVKGKVDAATLNVNATVWPYSHHVYYIGEQTYTVNNKSLTVPALMRKRLTSSGMITETIMEGVENVRFVFGLDTNGNSRVDAYRSVNSMQAAEWDNQKGILTVQLFLLVRTLQPEAGIKINDQKYILGEDSGKRELTFNDNYRRTVFTTTIRLNNVGANLWRI